jgi:NADH-quinone oxidoreductase subunit N
MAVSALIVLRTSPDAIKATASPEAYALYARASVDAMEGLLYYLCVYLFMNLGAFAIVALIRNQIFSEEIDDYKGLGFQSPALAACMAVCMFSLVGLPPLGGFFAKLAILRRSTRRRESLRSCSCCWSSAS